MLQFCGVADCAEEDDTCDDDDDDDDDDVEERDQLEYEAAGKRNHGNIRTL